MIQESLAREVLAKAVATGGDFAEIFLEDRVNHNLANSFQQDPTLCPPAVCTAPVCACSTVPALFMCHTNDTSREGLLDCAETAAAAIAREERSRQHSPPCPCTTCSARKPSVCGPVT